MQSHDIYYCDVQAQANFVVCLASIWPLETVRKLSVSDLCLRHNIYIGHGRIATAVSLSVSWMPAE